MVVFLINQKHQATAWCFAFYCLLHGQDARASRGVLLLKARITNPRDRVYLSHKNAKLHSLAFRFLPQSFITKQPQYVCKEAVGLILTMYQYI